MQMLPSGKGAGKLIVALGGEEAAILLQPGRLFRNAADANLEWAAEIRFLIPPDPMGGMLAVLPRSAGPAWLGTAAAHPVEREFQELLFDLVATDE